MNIATKRTPWMVASLLAATSVFGQNQPQNTCPPCQPQVCKPAKCCVTQAPQPPCSCAYNAPAEINVGCQGDIDFFASGSFLYWQPVQDNTSIGLSATTNAFTGAAPEPSLHASFIEMDFEYKPGFKAGLGMNLQLDDWDGYAEYTRAHGEHSTSSNGALADPNTPSIFSTVGCSLILLGPGASGLFFNTVSGDFRNNLDFVDVEMGRTYYVGKSLVFRSAFGARGAWILQNRHVSYVNNTAVVQTDPSGLLQSVPGVLDVYQRTHSWGVGPRIGLMMDWMLGCGIRFFGSGYGDILYTKYKVQEKTALMPRVSTGNLLVGNPFVITDFDRPIGLRTHLDLEMGFGWGSYFDNNNWHLDLSAAYGFQTFFNQNMFRVYPSTLVGTSNLYVHGLTATARVDF